MSQPGPQHDTDDTLRWVTEVWVDKDAVCKGVDGVREASRAWSMPGTDTAMRCYCLFGELCLPLDPKRGSQGVAIRTQRGWLCGEGTYESAVKGRSLPVVTWQGRSGGNRCPSPFFLPSEGLPVLPLAKPHLKPESKSDGPHGMAGWAQQGGGRWGGDRDTQRRCHMGSSTTRSLWRKITLAVMWRVDPSGTEEEVGRSGHSK